jgi:pimeloyl-ACP methyl ester carboxylesterase
MEAIVNGIKLAYDDVGNGPAMLLVHGFPLNRRMWHPQINALVAAGYRAIIPDLRGFGDSAAPDGPYSMDLFADDLITLLDHLEIDTATVAGMSMGGYILLNLLERYPQRISAACFCQTRANADDEAGKSHRLQLAQEAREKGPQVIADLFLPLLLTDESLAQRPRLVEEVYGWMVGTATTGLAGGLLAMRERKDYTPLLPTFYLPCLAIGGIVDKIVPPAILDVFKDGLPSCRTALIPDAGHMANLEAPGPFNAALLGFLAELAGKSFTYECC